MIMLSLEALRACEVRNQSEAHEEDHEKSASHRLHTKAVVGRPAAWCGVSSQGRATFLISKVAKVHLHYLGITDQVHLADSSTGALKY